MSRLTNNIYLEQRSRLRNDWFEDDAWTFIHLDSNDEIDLHEYFAPTHDYTDEQALEHRRAVSAARPSQPQIAGRAYARALQYLGKKPDPKSLPPPIRGRQPKGSVRVVTAHTVRNPNYLEDLSKALIAMTIKDIEREKQADSDAA
jgi:hypothetical protein